MVTDSIMQISAVEIVGLVVVVVLILMVIAVTWLILLKLRHRITQINASAQRAT